MRVGAFRIRIGRAFASGFCTARPRVRFAPSPTGELHLGGLRTALFNYLVAKGRGAGGDFVLRIEDTDQSRYVDGSVESLISTLEWANIPFDEGPGKEGDVGPYFQSQRLGIYREHVEQLLQSGAAYPCFCSADQIAQRASEQEANSQRMYDRHCRRIEAKQARRQMAAFEQEGKRYVIRLKMPGGVTLFEDTLRGSVSIDNAFVDDQVLLKSDGFPTYHLACVVDDHLMRINHVIRGEEWLSSVPKHVALYEAFGWSLPRYTHLPVILNPDGGKLSKRHAHSSVRQLREDGYLPTAVVNMIGSLGWSHPDKQVFGLQDMLPEFALSSLGKAKPCADPTKLKWFNQQHLRQLCKEDPAAVVALLRPLLAAEYAGVQGAPQQGWQERGLVALLKDKAVLLPDFVEHGRFLFVEPVLEEEPATACRLALAKVSKTKKADPVAGLRALAAKLEREDKEEGESAREEEGAEAFKEEVDTAVKEVMLELGLHKKVMLLALRYALTGKATGPGLSGMAALLGRRRTVLRLEEAAGYLTHRGA